MQISSTRKSLQFPQHSTETGHQASYNDFEVIGREKWRITFHVKIEESLLIKIAVYTDMVLAIPYLLLHLKYTDTVIS